MNTLSKEINIHNFAEYLTEPKERRTINASDQWLAWHAATVSTSLLISWLTQLFH